MNFFQRLKLFLFNTFLLLYVSKCDTIKFNLHKTGPRFENTLQFLTEIESEHLSKSGPDFSMFDFKLMNFKNAQYVGEIYIGSNQQKLDVIFDTGSHFLVVPEPSLDWQFSHTFSCNLSMSCLPSENQTVYLKYGSGSVDGYVAQDQISFGKDLVAHNTSFVIATDIHSFPREFNAAGVLGLRPINNLGDYFVYPNVETIAATNYSIIENLKAQGRIQKRQFSFFLNDEDQIDKKYDAEFTLGGYNEKHIQGDFSYFKVVHHNYWAIQSNGINVEGSKVKIPSKEIMAVIDSGTSLITFPKDIFALIIPIIKEKAGCEEIKQFMCLCSDGPCDIKPDDFPTITLDFDGFKASLPGRSYVLNIEGYNVLEIIGLDMSERFIILGNPFMRQYVTLFDAEEEEIGLAKSIYFIEPKTRWMKKLILLGIILTLSVLILCFVLWFVNKKKEEGDDNLNLLKTPDGEIGMTEIKHNGN